MSQFSPSQTATNVISGRSHAQANRAHTLFTEVAVKDLVALTKPGIIVLLLISTLCPMVLAAKGQVGLSLMGLVLLGGALMSASASTLNCIWDRDIDAIMRRTKNRPLPAGRISPEFALCYAILLAGVGFFILHYYVNPLAAALSLFGHLFYVLAYTIFLKRLTPQNIVIGGAAGAIPPLVGWAAVTGEVNFTACILFLVIFLWTPPHFWALALNKSADYEKAGVPMLPNVQGKVATKWQMFLYALSLIPVSVLLFLSDQTLGLTSLIGLVLLSSLFAFRTWRLIGIDHQLFPEKHDKEAWSVFGFSMIYLALFFILIVIDSTLI
ncbi:protoheme IX farnesyltransferase [bacterium]|nr:protoheme IX farnesyltransferase [bacterium]